MQQSDLGQLICQSGLVVSEAVQLSGDKTFKKQCEDDELVLISRLVGKINKRNSLQERLLLISTHAFYNISGRSIKRKVLINKIYGVTISRTSGEFIIHIPDEYDYRYKSPEHRDIIIQYLTFAVNTRLNCGLKSYFVDQDNLEQFTLLQKTPNKDKQLAYLPKTKGHLLYLNTFQIDHANLAYNLPNCQVLFILNPQTLRAKLDDLSKSLILGHGSICKTYLVTQKSSLLPMSSQQQLLVSKSFNRGQFDIDMDLLELMLQSYEKHPFIEQLELVFQQQNKLHFLFQLKRGGDLYQHIRQIGSFTEVQAKHIVSQVSLALSFLHEKGIVYGDLKPENILFDENGYIALTDFGYGKLRLHRLFRKDGNRLNFTPEYVPPEYLKQQELTRMSDWYQLGILIYELLVGIPPFYHPTSHELTIEFILQGQLHLPRNLNLSIDCVDLMGKLLTSDTSQRIGFKSDFKEISQHKWFEGVDLKGLMEKDIDLPYKPKGTEQQINENYFCMDQITEEERQW